MFALIYEYALAYFSQGNITGCRVHISNTTYILWNIGVQLRNAVPEAGIKGRDK